MAARIRLETISTADGIFENMPTALTAETAAIVEFDIDGLDITIVADSATWDTTDPMGYTIVITNTTPSPYEAPITVATDAYPVSVCTVDDTSVQLNGGTTGFTASALAGVLTVILDDDIIGGGTATITFQINKITTP